MAEVDYLWDGDKWIKSTSPGIRPIKLDLPAGYSKFKFYSQKDTSGYYSIYESQSGILIVNSFSKKLAESKARGEEMIKKYTKDAAAFQKLIDSQSKKLTAVVKKAFDKPKPGSKKDTSCSTAGKNLRSKSSSRAGKYLSTKCK